jgi:hypothetical protein
MPGKLHCALDRFGPRVTEEDPLLARAGSEARQALAQRGHALVVEVAPADVQEAPSRVLDRLDHLGMAVPGRAHGDPRHEIEVAVTVDILHHGAFSPRDDQRVFLDVAGGGDRFIPGNDGPCIGPRRSDEDFRVWFHPLDSLTVRGKR